MIDRIKFYINDISDADFDKIDSVCEFISEGEDRYSDYKYEGKLKNLRVRYVGRRLYIEGSLHKYAKGNNYSLFTYKEAKEVIIELSKTLEIPLEAFIVSSIELGLNIQMDEIPQKYLETLGSYKDNRFIPMSPLKKTSKIKGYKCQLSEYVIKFYDKSFEVIHSERIPKKDREKIPENILRYEIALSRKQLKNMGFKNVTGKNLQSGLHYSKFKKLLKRIFSDIIFKDFSINYSELLQDDVKRYIFALSDTYGYYMLYLKEYFGEKEYRKEKRRKNALMEKIAPLKSDKFEIELKTKFELALSEV